MLRRASIVVALAGALLVGGAASAASRPPASLGADIAEWSVVPSVGSLRAGDVRITVRNLGEKTHELVVVRTRSFAQDLPLRGDRALARPLVPAVVLAPGAVRSFTVHLKRGSYLLVDNLPWHYWRGASAAFAVR